MEVCSLQVVKNDDNLDSNYFFYQSDKLSELKKTQKEIGGELIWLNCACDCDIKWNEGEKFTNKNLLELEGDNMIKFKIGDDIESLIFNKILSGSDNWGDYVRKKLIRELPIYIVEYEDCLQFLIDYVSDNNLLDEFFRVGDLYFYTIDRFYYTNSNKNNCNIWFDENNFLLDIITEEKTSFFKNDSELNMVVLKIKK